ncbi:MAG: dihydropteroate synthase [Arenicella sp.]
MKDTFFCSDFQLNFSGNLKSFQGPIVMGILNVTPDSFYERSRMDNSENLVQTAKQMIREGAIILDIGGYSSRPGADEVSIEEEINRVVPAIKLLASEIKDVIISIDTFRSEVAEAALKAGALMVNDISGGRLDDKMFEVVAHYSVPYVLMHMKGTPQNMQSETIYKNLVMDINFFFSEQIEKAVAAGIHDIILDPGFGFSKTKEQNYKLMSQLEMLHLLDKPLLVGVSRKSMIYKELDISVDDSLNGTSVLNTAALEKGAQIIRVHDVKEAKQAIDLLKAIHCAE